MINQVTRGSSIAGSVAGCMNNWGYLQVCTKGKTYKAHRLVWLIEKGVWPEELDHINGVRTDNRIENLREVSRKENLRNQKTRCTSSSGDYAYNYLRATGVDHDTALKVGLNQVS